MPENKRKAFERKIESLIKKTKQLDRESVGGAVKLLKDLRKDVKINIATAEGWDAAYLPRLKVEINARLARFGGDLEEFVKDQQKKSWELGIRMTDEPLVAAGIRTALPLLSDELLLIAQEFTADLITGLEREIVEKISTRLNMAILGKETPWATMKKIDSEVFKIKKKAGVTFRTEQIVRMEVNRAYSISGQARMEQAADQVEDLMKRWETSILERARHKIVKGRLISHRDAHGQERKVNEPFDVSGELLMYPRDPSGSPANVCGCYCISVPFLRRFKE